MGLRNIVLKEEYRSDRDDIITEFFIPCLSNCMEYDRCIEFVSLKSLMTLALGFDNFARYKARMRIVTGHRFGALDLEMISRLFDTEGVFKSRSIRESKMQMLKKVIDGHQLELKIAIPNSEVVAGSFTEKIGIFIDGDGDVVTFTGTSNESFNTANRNFESIDVFTSWNDKSRVESKMRNFEDLWKNNTKYLEIFDFENAVRLNLVKYSSHWALKD